MNTFVPAQAMTKQPAFPAVSSATFLSVVTETYAPDINGVAHTIGHLVRGLVASGHYQIQLVRPDNGEAPEGSVPESVEQRLLPGITLPFYKEVRLGYPQFFALKKMWQERRPDLVQVVTEGPLGFAAVKAARSLGIPVVSDFHTNFDQYSRFYSASAVFSLASWYLRYLHNQTLMTLVPTDELRHQLESKGYARTGLMDRGTDAELFNPDRRSPALRERLGIEPDQLLVVLVSRIAQEKNLDLAFETFRAIQETIPEAAFLVVGDGPERARLEAAYPDCLFVGKKVGVELAEHYASGDLFLYPSTSETFGNVVIEAMISGLPTVAFAYAAAGQFIESGENGVTVPLDNNEEFIEAGVDLAIDELARRRMSAQAFHSVEHLSWERVVERLHLTFQQVLNEVTS